MENVVWQKILKYPLSGKYFLNGSSIKIECLTFYLKSMPFSSIGWEMKIILSIYYFLIIYLIREQNRKPGSLQIFPRDSESGEFSESEVQLSNVCPSYRKQTTSIFPSAKTCRAVFLKI